MADDATEALCVSVEELSSYMSGFTLTAGQREAAQNVLEGVQGELEEFLGRPVAQATRTETLAFDSDGRAYFTATPVISVASAVVNGTDIFAATPTIWTPGETWLLAPDFWSTQVTVTYLGGLDGHSIPSIRLGILRVAAREMEMRHDDTLSVKDLSARNEGEKNSQSMIGWQEPELQRVKRYRRRVVAL